MRCKGVHSARNGVHWRALLCTSLNGMNSCALLCKKMEWSHCVHHTISGTRILQGGCGWKKKTAQAMCSLRLVRRHKPRSNLSCIIGCRSTGATNNALHYWLRAPSDRWVSATQRIIEHF
jgi:hypothetical protein